MNYTEMNVIERWQQNKDIYYREFASLFRLECYKLKLNDHKRLEHIDFIKNMIPSHKFEFLNSKNEVLPLAEAYMHLTGIRAIFQERGYEDQLYELFRKQDPIQLTKQIQNNHEESLVQLLAMKPGEIVNDFVTSFGIDMKRKAFSERREFKGKGCSTWINRRGKLNFGQIIQLMSHRKTIKTTQYVHSKLLKVSIPYGKDNMLHSLALSEMMEFVSATLRATPVFVETSIEKPYKTTMYFKLKEYVSDTLKRKIEDYFITNFKFKIHIQKKEEIDYLQMPFSKSFQFYGLWDEDSLFRIKIATFKEIVDNIHEAKPSSISHLKHLFGSLYEGIPLKSKKIVCLINNDPLVKFSYGKGSRNTKQLNLALWCCMRKMSFTEYESLAYACNDGTSKDMAKLNSGSIRKILVRYYEFALRNADLKGINKWRVPEEKKFKKDQKTYTIADTKTKTILDDKEMLFQTKKYMNKFYLKQYTLKRQQGKWKEIFIEDSLNVLKFLLRKKKYHDKIKKTYIECEDKYKKLDDGIILPVAMYADLSKKLQLRSKLSRIISFLVDSKIISKIFIDGYTFSYKKVSFATHYIVKLSKEFILKLIKYIDRKKLCEVDCYKISSRFGIKNVLNLNNGYSLLSINYVSHFHERLWKRSLFDPLLY